MCGETEMTASSLRAFYDALKDKDLKSGISGPERHLKVSEINYHK